MNSNPSITTRQSRHQPKQQTYSHSATSPPPRNTPRHLHTKQYLLSNAQSFPSPQYPSMTLSNLPIQSESSRPPVTPTPKKRRRGRPPTKAQSNGGPGRQSQDVVSEEEPEDEEVLFALLGITSPVPKPVDDKARPGILPISRGDIEGSNRNSAKKGGKKNAPQSEGVGVLHSFQSKQGGGARSFKKERGLEDDRGIMSEGDSTTARDTSSRKPRNKPSASTSSVPTQHNGVTKSRPIPNEQKNRANADALPIVEDAVGDDAFETASLSQSLPTGGFFAPPPQNARKQNGRAIEDESLVWEMPHGAGPGAQELTWQQKLQAQITDTTRRNAKSNPSDRRKNRTQTQQNPPSAMPSSRPDHTRRLSLDAIPLPAKPAIVQNYPVSHFDSTIPFHTGFNVNRAPQTPAKSSTSKAASAVLPVLPGDFPRIQHPLVKHIATNGNSTPARAKDGAGQFTGVTNYAGPTFHNSPHGHMLPKPDLEDF